MLYPFSSKRRIRLSATAFSSSFVLEYARYILWPDVRLSLYRLVDKWDNPCFRIVKHFVAVINSDKE
ncbi:MAG: hypothetical protein LBP83_03815 [Dysgonamonadaceae bacterium]|nr:hypothetical protein [Dysgonamonadaceae bacterium]